MPTVLAEEPRHSGILPPPIWPADGGGQGGRGDGPGDPPSEFPVSRGQMGLWVMLTAIIMLFGGLSSAFIVLRGVPAWQNIAIPQLMWLNTLVLILSSVTIEFSRWAVRSNRRGTMKLWLAVSGMLGSCFLIGQVVVWQQLVRAGVYLPSTLHSSFFYILTGLHGIHLLGGMAGLGWVLTRAFRNHLTSSNYEPLRLCATYWHFMDLLWVYLAILLVLA